MVNNQLRQDYSTMKFVSRLAFTTPLLLSIVLLGNQSSSFAAVMGAEEATKLLARSQALEEKCKFLTHSQHDELSAFVAKAEIAMVAKSSAATAESIIESGHAAGKNAVCNHAAHADIVNIINAANLATSAATQANLKLASTPVAPKYVMVAATQVENSDVVKPVEKNAKLMPDHFPKNIRLNHYADITQRYYLARRCNTMSYGSISSLYKDVVSTHRNVVLSFGVPAVRSVMNQSESNAKASGCS